MLDRLASEDGRSHYAKRKMTVEPVFGNIKANLRFRRFSRSSRPRGPQRVAAHMLHPQPAQTSQGPDWSRPDPPPSETTITAESDLAFSWAERIRTCDLLTPR